MVPDDAVKRRYKRADVFLKRANTADLSTLRGDDPYVLGLDDVAAQSPAEEKSHGQTPTPVLGPRPRRTDGVGSCQREETVHLNVTPPPPQRYPCAAAAAGVRSTVLGSVPRWGIGTRDDGPSVPIIGFPAFPGLVYVPGYFTAEDQLVLANECLRAYVCSPNQTNVSRLHGRRTEARGAERSPYWPGNPEVFTKLRWATLGYQYDWTSRTYDEVLPFPPALRTLASDIIQALRQQLSCRERPYG